MKIKLTHHCGLAGAKGYIGDVIVCDDEVGQTILNIHGGVLLAADAQPPGPEPVETATEEAAPETAVVVPKRRGRPPKDKTA